MALEEHRVLYSLDKPFRILKWTIPEFLCIAIPCALGLFLDNLLMGACAGFGAHFLYGKVLKKLGVLRAWIYWVVPMASYRCIPPSWIRVIGR